MWPRNLLWKTCFFHARPDKRETLRLSKYDRSIDRSVSATRVNEHASDIKTASGLADALSTNENYLATEQLSVLRNLRFFFREETNVSLRSNERKLRNRIQVDGKRRKKEKK